MATATATAATSAPTSSLPRLGRMRFPLAARPFRVFGLPNPSPLVDKRGISIRCSYAVANVAENTIDVVADVKTERIVVLGGNGFVGSAICKAAVSKGIEVVSLSRSGRPSYSDSWVDQVTWVSGMILCSVFALS